MNLFHAQAALGLLLLSSTALATTISYDFKNTGTNVSSPSVSFTESGLTVEVTAFKEFPDLKNADSVTWQGNGLGVAGDPDGARLGTSGNDGDNNSGTNAGENNEALVFSWAPYSVTVLTGLVLENGGGNELFDILVDGVIKLDNVSISGPGTSVVSLDFSSDNLVGSEFTFMHERGSGIKVQGLTVEVPSAAPLMMLGLGLAGLGFARKKKQI